MDLDNKETIFFNEEVMKIPVCQELTRNWQAIRDEALLFLGAIKEDSLNGKSTTPFTYIKVPEVIDEEIKDSITLLVPSGNWEAAYIGSNRLRAHSGEYGKANEFMQKVSVRVTGKTIQENSEYSIPFFNTYNQIVESLLPDGCTASSLSIVSPGTFIKPHFGNEKYIRCHLCLVNDTGCTITIGGQTSSWEEGKILAFRDGGKYSHSVKHNGERDRINITFDLDVEYVKQFSDNIYL